MEDGIPETMLFTYTETKSHVESAARVLGLVAPELNRSRHRTVYACGEERLPTASWRVREMFSGVDLPSVYPLFSGYSHGELFAMLHEFEQTSEGNLGMNYPSIVNEESFKGAVAISAYALYPSAEPLISLFGLESQ